VPSVTILEQTVKNLSDPRHPYRQKINSQFGNRVEVYEKKALLSGSGFNASSVQEQLSIFVLSFDSLRAKNKEDRKVYQENGNLLSFGSLIKETEEISLIKVIQFLNPMVIVDESHNAESDLSVEMVRNINPCFVLDLTATPRNNSNIISFVDALALKKENMVKLPVIVYNHKDKADVISSAIQLRNKLEVMSNEEYKSGGRYIRPIVLFQAQPKSANDHTTFEKLKEKLIELKIPGEQVKIKTAGINEIKDIDLLSESCSVRYIITVNALKEGWDCPFAFVLASLADKSSEVDVEQILGRILRQPYVVKHNAAILNMSYVLTASGKFLDTLDNIVKGLNRAGFSRNDFKLAEAQQETEVVDLHSPVGSDTVDSPEIIFTEGGNWQNPANSSTPAEKGSAVVQIEELAVQQNEAFEKKVIEIGNNGLLAIPNEVEMLVKKYKMRDVFSERALQLRLPRFYIKKPAGDIFNEENQMLSKEDLLEGFHLAKSDANISFDSVSSDLYKVDLDQTKGDHTPSFVKLDGEVKDRLISFILDPLRKESRVKNFTSRILAQIGDLQPLTDSEIKKYIQKILENFTDAQYADFAIHEYSYTDKIRVKIQQLSAIYAEQRFKDLLDVDKIHVNFDYLLSREIIPAKAGKDIVKSLYEKEAEMNGFEERVINEVANLQTILFWTKNIERRQFFLNGFINHYPDFIVHTKSGKTILLETKGDDRDNSDSDAKIRLGKAWEARSGSNFKYFMVFDQQEVTNAHKLQDLIRLLKEI
jgi:type III restriction enzyme